MWRHRCCVISHKLSNLSVPSLPDSAVSNAADFNSTCFMRPQPGFWKAKHRKPSMRFEAPGKAQLTVAENSSSSQSRPPCPPQNEQGFPALLGFVGTTGFGL